MQPPESSIMEVPELLTHLWMAYRRSAHGEEEAWRPAAVFERLSEESAQAAAMTRALPDRPCDDRARHEYRRPVPGDLD
jgi:hypothetical protein